MSGPKLAVAKQRGFISGSCQIWTALSTAEARRNRENLVYLAKCLAPFSAYLPLWQRTAVRQKGIPWSGPESIKCQNRSVYRHALIPDCFYLDFFVLRAGSRELRIGVNGFACCMHFSVQCHWPGSGQRFDPRLPTGRGSHQRAFRRAGYRGSLATDGYGNKSMPNVWTLLPERALPL